MTEREPTSPPARRAHDQPRRYEVRLDGHLHERWRDWFDAVSLTNQGDGTALILVDIVDQAALQGVLHKLRDVGVPLISVAPAPTGPAGKQP